MQTSVLQSPPGHKRRSEGEYIDEISPSKVPLYQQGGTPQQQWRANRSPHQQTPPQQHYTAQRGTEPFENAITPQTLRNASHRVDPTAWQLDPRKWQPPTPETRAGIAAQQQAAPGVAAARMAAAVNNSQPFNYHSQSQQQQQQPPAAACTPVHQSPSQSWQPPQQAACVDQHQWQQQQQLPQQSPQSPCSQETRQQGLQQQQQGLWQQRNFCCPQQQQGPRSPFQAAQQQQLQTEFAAPSRSPVAAGLYGSSSSIGHGSSTGSSTSLFAAAAAGMQRGSNSPGWTAAAAAAVPPSQGSVTAAAATSNMASTPVAAASREAPAAAAATPRSSSSSIWRLIRHSFRLQKAVADRNVDTLCVELGLDEWHVRHEVSRLNKYFALTFPMRLVLEQFGVLDFVSSRTLMQISHLPPQHITLLDTWLRQDLAAAAAGAGSGSSGAADMLIGGSLATKHSHYWLSNKGGGVAAFSDVPPSWAILQLLMAGRLKWVPSAAAAAAVETVNTSSAAAAAPAAGPFTAAKHGSYVWQHGPVDAWLCNDPTSSSSSSSSGTVAAARTARAEQLKNSRFPRNQAKLLLDLGFAAAAGAATPGSVDLLGFGCLEFGFSIDDLSHSSSCHLQRHPVLGDHDRLIRVSLNRSAAATAAAAAGSSGGSEETSRALEGLLTHGVMLAGRRYRRLVQKDIGQAGESLWLLATDSVCPEDTAGPEAWPHTNPAAARQLLGGFSSLPNVSKQSARGALLVSNTLPVKVPAYKVFYIPDIQGPTDTQGNVLPPSSGGNSSSSSSELIFSDGSGFISADVAELVPAISAGEIISGDRGGGVMWPGTPMQVRVFDPHFGGVIAKGTLTPLQQSVLPHGTIVLRSSQVKAPAAKHFGEKWIKHWDRMLVWAYQQHEAAWQQQQQQLQQQQWLRTETMHQRWVPAAAAAAGPGQTWSNAAAAAAPADHHHEQQQQRGSVSSDHNLLASASAAAAAAQAQRPLLSLLHPQDRPWFEQLWYVYDALQLYGTAVSSSSSSNGNGVGSAALAAATAPPKACQCVANPLEQQQQEDARSAACNTISTFNLFSAASSSSASTPAAAAATGCACDCVLEVVSRAPAGCERACELRINKNLLLLLHNAGVPQHVFEQWSDIEQHKLVGIDSSYEAAYAAAKSAGELEVTQKLESLIGVQLQHPGSSSSSSTYASSAVTGVTNLSTGFSNLGISHLPNMMSLPLNPSAAAAAAGSSPCPRFMSFKPDLALKQDLHAIKVRRRAKMANMSLPVPSAEDTAAAVRTGIIPAEGNSFCSPNATGGVRLLGLPDPSCGSVPEGCVAVSPALVPPSQQAVIYRDPGIHTGDVRRARVIPYPQQLQQLLPPNFSGAIFLPTVGNSCLGASLAGGDYDGDHYLLLWDERVITWFRAQDPEPWQGLTPCAGGGRDRWGLEEGSGWECVEQKLTEYYSFCCRVAGLIGEAHTLWEAYADRCGVDSMYCKVLAEGYYQALDAAKTGTEPTIQDYYRHNSALGVDINHLPPWHSRVVKECARTGRQSGLGACAREGMTSCPGKSQIVRALWCRVHDLEPVDYLDTALLDLDPDLLLQEGPAAVCKETMEQLIDKWDRLCGEWNCSWAQIMRKTGTARSRAEQRSLIDEKAELQLMLKAKFQLELWGGLEAVAAAAAGSGSSILDRVLMEASACYQAVYRRAKTKQDKLHKLTADQRTRQALDLGYEDQPRVAMAWRVAGQWLRMLKATKPLRLQQAQMLQELQRMQERCPAVWASGGSLVQMSNGSVGGLEAYRGCLGGAGSARVELGSVQHPYLAGIVAQQQSRRGQMRSNRGFGDLTGLD